MSLELILSSGKPIPIKGVNYQFQYSNDYRDCEGRVFGVELIYGNESRKKVVVKEFYRRTFDDNGIDFIQNSNRKVQESFDAFRFLKEHGFQIPTMYGILRRSDEKVDDVLVVEDLEQRGVELIDEKLYYRGSKEKFRNKIEGASNFSEIEKRRLVDRLKLSQLGVSIGNGDSLMYLYDESTNTVDYVFSDVGGFERVERKSLELEDLFSRFSSYYNSQQEAQRDWEEIQGNSDFKLRKLVVQQLLQDSSREITRCWEQLNCSRELFCISDETDSNISRNLLQAKFEFYRLATREFEGQRIFPELSYETLRGSSNPLDLATLALLESVDLRISRTHQIPIRNSGFSLLETELPETVEIYSNREFRHGKNGKDTTIRFKLTVPYVDILQSGRVHHYDGRFELEDVIGVEHIEPWIRKIKGETVFGHDVVSTVDSEEFQYGEMGSLCGFHHEKYGVHMFSKN